MEPMTKDGQEGDDDSKPYAVGGFGLPHLEH